MAENSNIEWTDHTFNPWIGCTKVSPACDHCYAEELMDHRLGKANWGPGEPRQRTSIQNWNKPIAWDRKAAKTGVRPKVFCASLADVFDVEVSLDWRHDLFKLISATPNLDWLLLTKRPHVARGWFATAPEDWDWWPNIWLGTTVENQDMATARIPALLSVTEVAKRFLSMEPLLGPVDLSVWLDNKHNYDVGLNWVIVGGESGRVVRTMRQSWAADIMTQCTSAGVPFFMKQMSGSRKADRIAIPEELMLREMPS